MKKIYLSLIIISVGLSLGITTLINKSYQVGDGEKLGATITEILPTDQISDSRTTINNNFTNLNNAIHWSSGSNYLYTSSSPTFGIILGDTSSSTIGSLKITGNLNITGNVTSTNATSSWLYISDSLTIGAFILPNTDGSANQILKTNGSGVVTWQGDDTGTAAWEYDSGTGLMTTTSTLGIYLTASSIFTASTTMASTSIQHLIYDGIDADNLFKGRGITSYLTDYTTATGTGSTMAELFGETITGGDMGTTGILRCRVHGIYDGGATSQGSTIGISFGGFALGTSTNIVSDSNETKTWSALVEIYNRGSENLQWSFMETRENYDMLSPERYALNSSSTEMSINTALDQELVVNGVCVNAGSSISVRVGDCQIIK